jgi:glycosyltransferase involved in cell wall biosynthesis
MRKPRVGYLVSHPIQYQAPLFRLLAQSPKMDFVALFGCDYGVEPSFDPQFGREVDFGVDLLAGYRFAFLPQRARPPRIDSFWGLRTPSVDTVWQTSPVDVLILHGWRTAMMWQAAAGARRRGAPYLMRAETPVYSGQGTRPTPRKLLRNLAVSRLARGAARALALGPANERFYRSVGVRDACMVRVPYFVDNAAVAEAAARGRGNRSTFRRRHGIPEDAFVVVGLGKLMKRKRPLDLVRVLPAVDPRVHVVWIGSGELHEPMRAEAERLGVRNRLHLLGFQPTSEAWTSLGACDLFVLPAEREPWGLVVNEAVVAGLPVVVSDEVGAAESLVVREKTGSVIPVGDLDALAAAVEEWARRAGAGDRGDETLRSALAEEHSLERAAAQIEFAVASLGTPPC